jgi:hypothetical protein
VTPEQVANQGDLLEQDVQNFSDAAEKKADASAKAEHQITKTMEEESKKREEFDEAYLTIGSSIADQLGDIFTTVYELGGKQEKRYLELAKAAGIAKVIINTQMGIMKALGEEGAAGYVQAGLIAVQGALAIAKISAQGLAEGGLVPGRSPHEKADNIPAMLTAGEYVLPRRAVQFYGPDTLEAVRQMAVPRSVMDTASDLAASGLASARAAQPSETTLGLAEGGLVPKLEVKAEKESDRPMESQKELTIVNVVDRDQMLGALSTMDGQRVVLNVLAQNAYKVKRIISG